MARPGATDRLARVLAYVPWIAARDGPTVKEVSARFDVSEKQLLADLGILQFIGLPPYTPDALMEVVVEEGRVWISYADFFSDPLRLTPEEGLSLVAAGAVLRELPGHDQSGPLARGLEKLAAVLGVDPDLTDTGQVDREVLEILTTAANEHRAVDLAYYSYGRDERTERRVEPWRVFHDIGAWYVVGHCHLAGGERVFRLDRVERAALSDTTFAPPPAAPAKGVFSPRDDDHRVVLDLAPEARWVLEQYPVERVDERDDGSASVTLVVAAPAWYERLLLRLGPAASVIDAPEALVDARERAASHILARY